MNGVEILSSFEYVTKYGWNPWIFAALLGITALLAFVFYFAKNEYFIFVIVIGLLASIIVSSPVCGSTPTEYETRYKVIIDNTVSLNEFFETYEIVDQDGKIYIVREIKKGELNEKTSKKECI